MEANSKTDDFLKENQKVITSNFFPPAGFSTNITLTSCNFHLIDEKEEDNNNIFSSSLPITLKEHGQPLIIPGVYSPMLILFYYDSDREILNKWSVLVNGLDNSLSWNFASLPVVGGPPPVNPIEAPLFATVNLDYEKKLYQTFKNISLTNPFNWAKILDEEKRHFVIFYYNTLPVEFYEGILTQQGVRDKYYRSTADNWKTNLISIDNITDKKRERYRVFDHLSLKGKYFRAAETLVYNGFQFKKGEYYTVSKAADGGFVFRPVRPV